MRINICLAGQVNSISQSFWLTPSFSSNTVSVGAIQQEVHYANEC